MHALSCFLLSTGYEKTQSLRFCLALGDAWLKDPNLEVSNIFYLVIFIINCLVLIYSLFKSWAGSSTGQRRDLFVQAEAAVSALSYWEHVDNQPSEQPGASETDWAASQAHSGSVWAQQCGAALQRHRKSNLSWWACFDTENNSYL